MLGAAAKRIVHPIRKPRNNADEAIAAKPGWDGAGRAICCVAPLANGAYHWLRVASCISSRRASVATTRDLFRGSLARNSKRVARLDDGIDNGDPSIAHAAGRAFNRYLQKLSSAKRNGRYQGNRSLP